MTVLVKSITVLQSYAKEYYLLHKLLDFFFLRADKRQTEIYTLILTVVLRWCV